jgi:hypothetical protein
MKRWIVVFFTVIAAAVMLSSCATTEVTAVWKDQSYKSMPHKVLVYGVLKKVANRRIIEDEFVSHLESRGVKAVAGYTVFPGEELVTKEILAEKLKTLGFDTLLLTQLTGTKTEQVQVPGTVTYQAAMPGMYQPLPYHNTWPGYYNSGYTSVYTPGYTAEEQYVMAQANLYDVATEKLIWTASTKTRMVEPDQKMIKTYVAVIMDAMRKQKVVP